MNIPQELKQAMNDLKFIYPTQIQNSSIPLGVASLNIIG